MNNISDAQVMATLYAALDDRMDGSSADRAREAVDGWLARHDASVSAGAFHRVAVVVETRARRFFAVECPTARTHSIALELSDLAETVRRMR